MIRECAPWMHDVPTFTISNLGMYQPRANGQFANTYPFWKPNYASAANSFPPTFYLHILESNLYSVLFVRHQLQIHMYNDIWYIYIYICTITVRIYIYIHVDMIPWCCISLSLCSLPSDLLPATSIPLCLFQIAIAHSERRSAKCCEDCNPPYYLPCSPPATTGFVQQMYKQSTLRWTKTT